MSDARGLAAGERAVRHEVVHLDTLEHVFRRPRLSVYLGQLWNRRHFIRADARGRVVSGNRGMLLGSLWLVLKPVLDGAVYLLIFGVILQSSRGIDNFIGYLIIGVFLFQYTGRCLSIGANSLLTGRSLIKGFVFPRAVLPIAAVVREVYSLGPTILAMLAVVLCAPPFEAITWRWLLFPVVLTMQTFFNIGLALIAARVTARVPDLNNVISFFVRIWLYGSGVFLSFDNLVHDPTVLMLLKLNPMYVVLDMARDILLYAATPELDSWLVLGAWSAAITIAGFVFFWRGEESYGSL